MGKEIRAGLSVVGALLIAFCFLLYARFARNPAGITDVSIETHDVQRAGQANRRVRSTPTIVGSQDPYGSSTDERNLGNPRRNGRHSEESSQDNDTQDHDQFLPIAPAAPTEELISTRRGQPDAIAPSATMSVTVQSRENLQVLAERLYGSEKYERALWQWLFDREQVNLARPGSTLQLPTRATLERNYGSLVPEL